MKTTITTITVLLLAGSITSFANAEEVPDWVKSNAGWWQTEQFQRQNLSQVFSI